MTNRPKIVGTRFESAVVAYLRERGWVNAERRALRGKDDRGDIAGIPGTVWECKALRVLDLAGALAEATQEARNAKGTSVVEPYAFAVLKRRQRAVSEAYAVMTLETLCDLLSELEGWSGNRQ